MAKEMSKILGIIGIIFAFFIPVIGLVLGIIGLCVKKPKNKKLLEESRRLNIIAIVLSILSWIVYASIIVA